MIETKVVLSDKEIPKQWYNIMADMPNLPLPPLHPGTKQPVGPDDLSPIFPMGLIVQEVSQERWIDIPEEVLDIYSLWRPSPLYRAHRLENALGTPAKIFYKYEGVSPAGSHKPNSSVPQAWYNAREGVKRLTTETGAGQWGSALAFACQRFGLACTVYMVRVSYDTKPYRRSMISRFFVFRCPSAVWILGVVVCVILVGCRRVERVEVPVIQEKIVEKIVEKPVEKVVEKIRWERDPALVRATGHPARRRRPLPV